MMSEETVNDQITDSVTAANFEPQTQLPPPVQQQPILHLTLNLQEVNVILAALHEAPFKLADPILRAIYAQGQKQLKDLEDQQNQQQ